MSSGVPATDLRRFAFLSIAAALVTIGLKAAAWWLTGSVGLLSDALESLVNLVAAVITLFMLVVAARPPDEHHAYGHEKAEYFASGAEGALILVAATKDVVEKGFKAGDLIREMAKEVGGSGGGKPDMAQAGGSDPSKIPAAFERLYGLIRR